MKQVVVRDGEVQVVEIPAPVAAPGYVLVANAASAVSSGTERASAAARTGSLPLRAIRNPDLVKKTLDHARQHGWRETAERVRGVVGADSPMGYSTAGVVVDTGGIPEFRVGQAVACAGAGYASHAEVVSVPGNLVASVPEGVALDDAAFATIGAIALQGVRRAEPTLGERVVVIGLGLVGLLSVQILRAAGCQVVGVEPVERRRELALSLGASRAVAPTDAGDLVLAWSEGVGADAVIVAAASSKDAVINQAIGLTRRRGRVVPVGDVGLGITREPLYQREADVLISTSYGPGRYDPTYEEGGLDYPLAYVRWTENRNMQEFLRLVGAGAIQLSPLIDLRLPIDRAPEAYAALASEPPPLAVALTYDDQPSAPRRVITRTTKASEGGGAEGTLTVAVVGTGSIVQRLHVPNLRKAEGVRIKTLVSRRGTTSAGLAGDDTEVAADWRVAVEDPEIDLVVIATRHDTHAEIAAAALRAGKAVFLEKPLGLSWEEIDAVWAAGRENDRLAIGFNRPFAPLAVRLGEQVRGSEGPIQLVYRVSAPLAADHWLNDPQQGGGRLLGEACHMFDFANWICGTPERVFAAALPPPQGLVVPESASVLIQYAGGSTATVDYSGVGGEAMPKERVEVLRGGRAWVLDDFRTLTAYDGGERQESSRRQDKGHARLLAGVVAACRTGAPLEPGLEAAYAAQSVALSAVESIASGAAVPVRPPPG